MNNSSSFSQSLDGFNTEQLEIGIKKHRIHHDDIKKLLLLFELLK